MPPDLGGNFDKGDGLLGLSYMSFIDYYSTWPLILVFAMIYLVAGTPLYRYADAPPAPFKSRVDTLDGLRGVLALAVFFSHLAVFHQYNITGKWEPTPATLYSKLGQAGVAIFFMITGFLFWGQIARKNGRPDWVSLYVGRLFRILPLYWLLSAFVVGAVAAHTGWQLHVPLAIYLKQVCEWFSGGIFGPVYLNNDSSAPIFVADAIWTLKYEWWFYASLFFLAATFVGPKVKLWLPAIALPTCLFLNAIIGRPFGAADPVTCITLFSAGMLISNLPTNSSLKPNTLSLFSMAFLAAAFSIPVGLNANLGIIFLMLVFSTVVLGGNIFGLLISKNAKRLGDISFGVYLLQGPVLSTSYSIRLIKNISLSTPMGHWSIAVLDAFLLITAAMLAHVLIERPGINLGRKFISIISRRIYRNKNLGDPSTLVDVP